MTMALSNRYLVSALFFAAISASFTQPTAHGEGGVITGVVRDADGPVPKAVVRVQATTLFTKTNDRGEFVLSGVTMRSFIPLTAFAPGYYIAGPLLARAGDTNISFLLHKHPEQDDPTYEWLSAFSSAGNGGNCQNCHSETESGSKLPFDEWRRDAHGTAATNRRFLSMYNGTDLSGLLRSPLTRYGYHKDYGRFPLPPDLNQPYYGPGFKLDFPESAGNCAACHLPAAAVNEPYQTDSNTVSGVGLEGVACDLCHKIWAVRLQPSTGLPYPNTPGVLSLEFLRPPSGHQLFIGPFDDVAPGEDSYSPLQNQSQICAPCHFGQFWGVQVYNSFGEWLESPYSDPENGQTCQDCHMPRRGVSRFARAEKGGLQRDPETIFSHLMPGAADVALLQDTAKLEVEAQQDGPIIRAKVLVTNEKAGHHIPTDHPARNILLVVSATDGNRQDLPFVGGPLVPDWGGAGDEPTDYAGRPGRGFAKILEELWTEISPTAAYWNPTILREDSRIPALGSDVTHYEFRAPPAGGPVHVNAKLIFRRAFKSLGEMKSWGTRDILMEQAGTEIASVPSPVTQVIVVSVAGSTAGATLAPESIASGLGQGLATATEAATGLPLPVVLSGVSVILTDGTGADRLCPLFFVSPGRITFQVPPGTKTGPGKVRVTYRGQALAKGDLMIAAVSPGLFTANSDGRGVAAAVAVRVAADGTRATLPVFECTDAPGSCVATPIGAGPQGQYVGLDQVNVLVPRALLGHGEVDVALTADGKPANVVTVSVL
jgi:mono/diheme cytochrome c family protein